jgi:hypothetical protein
VIQTGEEGLGLEFLLATAFLDEIAEGEQQTRLSKLAIEGSEEGVSSFQPAEEWLRTAAGANPTAIISNQKEAGLDHLDRFRLGSRWPVAIAATQWSQSEESEEQGRREEEISHEPRTP